MVELRKRKAPAEAAPAPSPKKSSNPVKKALDAAKDAVIGNSASSEGATNGSAKIAVGQTIALEGFGGELETHTGDKVTLSKLLEQSQAGVVIFTYPKANTPGCKSIRFSTVNRGTQINLNVGDLAVASG
jgi:peroxiredoxin Q/BCP